MELHELHDVPPNQTVYANNLDDGLKKEYLRRQLYCLFSQYGVILDVVALKTQKMRGQAFVTFRDIASATQAMRSLQGFSFFGKPMRLQYSKHKANVIAQIEGTYDPRKPGKRKVIEFGVQKAGAKKITVSAMTEVTERPDEGRSALDERANGSALGQPPPPPPPPPIVEQAPPNKILFVENLPEQVNEMMLRLLFQQFDGFREVRLVPGKVGIAFVEFGSDAQSQVAMGALQSFKITPTHLMAISFAKA